MNKTLIRKLSLFASLLLSVYYESSAAHSQVQLDQSQGVFFDSFDPSTFSLQLLQAKSQFNPNNLIIGGSAEFDAQQWTGSKVEEFPIGQIYQQGTGLYWTQANLDAFLQPTSWSSLFLSGTGNYIGTNYPDSNYFYSQHAFVVFGDLNAAPVYSTVGINTIPFGVFEGSGPWDVPLTAAYFSPAQAPQISMAYYKNGWNLVATGFQNQTNYDMNYAYSLYYNKNTENFGYSLGAGYLTNLPAGASSSWAAQPSKSRKFSSFGIGDLGSIVDINGSIQFYAFSLGFEYNQGSKKIAGNDSLPQAYAISANYEKNLWGKDTSFGITRSVALNLNNVPTALTGEDNLSSTRAGLRNTLAFNISRLIFKNTWLGVDFQKATVNPQLIQSNKQVDTYTTTFDLMVYL